MFSLACIYHATTDVGVAATNFLKTLLTAQRRRTEESERGYDGLQEGEFLKV